MPLSKVKDTIKKYNLIKKGDRILAGVSGGPDSLALLYLLDSLKRDLGFSLCVAHLDHMLRIGSGRDAEFVGRICARLGLRFFPGRVDVKKLSGNGSLEETARNARLDFLFRAARTGCADKIALGHNFDDQAETVLMRILRGTGLYGLSGILPKRDIAGFCIIRPLVHIRRKEIESYLKKKGVRPLRDATNLQDVYFRNKIRNKLLPLLEIEYNPNIREVLANMSESASCDYDYLSGIARARLKKGRPQVSLKKLTMIHPAIRRLMLRALAGDIAGDALRLSFRHIRELEDLAANRPPDSVVNLPGGISAVKKKNTLYFCRP